MKLLFRLSILVVLIASMLVSVTAAKLGENLLHIKLVDSKQEPILNVTLRAWHVGVSKSKGKAVTNAAGMAVLRLNAGSYFIGGDVSAIYSRLSHQDVLKEAETCLMYLSSQVEVKDEAKANEVVLTINEEDYLDIVDYTKRNIEDLVVKQTDTKMNIILKPKAGTKLLRLFLPQRKIYEVGCSHEDFTVLRPVNVFPGLKFQIGVRQ